MIKIAHVSDIHIRNHRYHENYRAVFNKLYDSLRDHKVDLIFVLGDIAHTKINLSAEFFEMAYDFLDNLSNIAPTYTILGNHDANLVNLNRQDAISPIAKTINNKNFNFIKYSGVISIDEFDIDIHHMSLFDKDWPKKEDIRDDRINIAMYHGPLNGCVTDVGYHLESKINKDLFEPYDYTFLGDIHKAQPMNEKLTMWYAGSLIQQNYGESYDKGYLLWEIENKEDFSIDRIVLDNPEPFINITIPSNGINADHPNPPKGSRVRYIVNKPMTSEEIKFTIGPINHEISPKEYKIVKKFDSSVEIDKIKNTHDYRSPKVQEKFLTAIFENKNISQKTINRAIEINNEICDQVSKSEIARNVIFDLGKMSWSNLFSYGKDNVIDFSTANGLIGIFGKNAIGKSSVVDTLLFSMFNSVSRKTASVSEIVNNKRSEGVCKITLKDGSDEILLERKIEKKKNKSGDIKPRMHLIYKLNGKNKTGKSRQDTDINILRPYIGDIEDYLTTTVSSQGDMTKFIDLGPSERKDYLIKILDISFFDEQYDIAKKRMKPFKSLIESNKSIFDIEKEIEDNREILQDLDSSISDLKLEIAAENKSISELKDRISVANEKINSFNISPINSADVVRSITKHENEIAILKRDIENLSIKIKKCVEISNEDYESEFDKNEYEESLEELDRFSKLIDEYSKIKKEIELYKKKSSLLETIPCGDMFPTCPLIQDAISSKKDFENRSEILQILKKDIPTEKEINQIKLKIKILEQAKEEDLKFSQRIDENKRNMEVFQSKLKLKQSILEKEYMGLRENKSKLESYNNKKSEQESIAELKTELKEWQKQLDRLESNLRPLEKTKESKILMSGKLYQKITALEELKEKLNVAKYDLDAYEALTSALSRNGIVQEVLQNMQDAINSEINSILSEVVDFQVYFDFIDPKCRIYIKYDNQEPRYLELASGMEKMISSLAVRVGLMQLSSLPKLSTLIIDESFGTLDAENRESMSRIFNTLREKFKNILIISHIDSIKDMVDHTIEISQDSEGFSKIKH